MNKITIKASDLNEDIIAEIEKKVHRNGDRFFKELRKSLKPYMKKHLNEASLVLQFTFLDMIKHSVGSENTKDFLIQLLGIINKDK